MRIILCWGSPLGLPIHGRKPPSPYWAFLVRWFWPHSHSLFGPGGVLEAVDDINLA